jgi:hypothetical protein
VAGALSTQHGVSTPTAEELLEIDPSILARVPEELCRRLAVLPFRLGRGTVCLAMRDPQRHLAGEISFAIERPVVRYVVPELRIMYLLERHLGLAREPRFLREPPQKPAEDERRTHMAPTISVDPTPSQSEESMDLKRSPTEESMDLAALAESTLACAGVTGTPDEPVRALRSVDVTLAKLAEAQDGESIVRLLVEPVVEGTEAALLFFVRERHAVACCASGITTSPERLQRLVVPLGPSSLMQWAAKMFSVVRGIADPLQWEIAKYFGVNNPGEVCVAPLVPRRKVVNLLCIWAAPEKKFGEDALQVLGELVKGGAAAYLDLARRLRGLAL